MREIYRINRIPNLLYASDCRLLRCLFPAIAEYRSGAQTLFHAAYSIDPTTITPQDAKM
jgi:hypothetical protein